MYKITVKEDTVNLYEQLAKEFGLKKKQVEGAIHLIDEGNTIPFIARYRKEATGEMSDEVLRDFYDRLKYLRNLEDRKEQVKSAIEEQNKLTAELISALQEAKTLVEVEDIYEPYKKKRKTRASVAIEKGLEPLSEMIRLGEDNLILQAKSFVNEENEILTEEEALQGAMDIIAQQLSEDFERKKKIRNILFSPSRIETSQN